MAQRELISAGFEGNRLTTSLNPCKEGGLYLIVADNLMPVVLKMLKSQLSADL